MLDGMRYRYLHLDPILLPASKRSGYDNEARETNFLDMWRD